MKKLFYERMLITICVLLVLGCQKEALVTEVSPTGQGLEKNGQAAQKASVYSENLHFPVDYTAFSQCAGEELHFTGSTHWNLHTTMDAKGSFHSVFINNDHNLSGVGLTSGIKYHQVGKFTEVYTYRGTAPFTYTVTVTFNFIGQGPGNNAINKYNYHITINANEVTTVIVENATTILCQ